MKDKIQIAISIGLMCVLLTGAIVVQLNTIEKGAQIVGTTYAEQSLKDAVLRWKENYENIYDTLEKTKNELERVRQDTTKENDESAELEEKLSNANKLLGLTELTGTGVIVTLADNDTINMALVGNVNDYVVHDGDLMEVVNELKNAGAEAISINGQRITSITAISCQGTVITVNGEKINSPFIIKAIGNSESLSAISRPGGYIEWLQSKNYVITSIEKSNNVTVEKYNGVISSKYMKNVQ